VKLPSQAVEALRVIYELFSTSPLGDEVGSLIGIVKIFVSQEFDYVRVIDDSGFLAKCGGAECFGKET